MIACDVSHAVILGQVTACSFFSQQRGSGWEKALSLIRLVWGWDELEVELIKIIAVAEIV